MGIKNTLSMRLSQPLRSAAAVSALIAFTLTCAASSAGFASPGNILAVPWAECTVIAESVRIEVAFGLRRLVVGQVGKLSNGSSVVLPTGMYPYESAPCEALGLDTDVCETCGDARGRLGEVTVIGIMTHTMAVVNGLMRIPDSGNSLGKRVLSASVALLGAVMGFAAVATFKASCYDSFAQDSAFTASNKVRLGPAFHVTVAALVFDLIVGVLHGISQHDPALPWHRGTPLALCFSKGGAARRYLGGATPSAAINHMTPKGETSRLLGEDAAENQAPW